MSRSAASDLGLSVGTLKGDRQTFMYFGDQVDSDGQILMYFGGQVDNSNVDRFRKRLFQAIGQGFHEIVFDLEHLEFITSAGLAALIEAARFQRATDGSLLLRSLRPQPRHLLDLTGLAELFEPRLPDSSRSARAGKDLWPSVGCRGRSYARWRNDPAGGRGPGLSGGT